MIATLHAETVSAKSKLDGFTQRQLRNACWTLCALGIALRLWALLVAQDLWLDEAVLALNLVHLDFGQLMAPLRFAQAAPLGFLWLTKAAVILFHESEISLRLVACVGSIGSVFAFRRLLLAGFGQETMASVWALALFTLNPVLIDYAAQVKPYSWDVLMAVLLLGAFQDFADDPARRSPWPWGLAAVAAPWLSFPSVFVVAGLGLLLLLRVIREKSWSQLWRALAPSIFGALSFTLVYLISTRRRVSETQILSLFDGLFLSLPASLRLPDLEKVSRLFTEPFVEVLGVGCLALIAFFLTLGCVATRRSWWLGAGGVAPLGMAMAGSFARFYPWVPRCVLFLVPGLIWTAALGLGALLEVTPKGSRMQWTLLLAAFLLCSSGPLRAGFQARHPFADRGIRALFRELERGSETAARPVLFIDTWSHPVFEYYNRLFHFDEKFEVHSSEHGDFAALPEYSKELQSLRGGQLWMVFPDCRIGGDPYREQVRQILRGIAPETDRIELAYAKAYRYALPP